MGRVLTGRGDAVMTRTAGAQDVRVIDCEHRRKDISVVAVFTAVTGLDVCRVLAGRIHAVVAVNAISSDVQMIEIGRQPPRRGMAIVTRIFARQMIQVFARRDNAVMAGTARTDYLHVIDNVYRGEGIRIVAVLTNNGCLYVSRVLTCRGGSIVTATAVVEDIRMIEVRRQPGGACVAVVAACAARDMCWIFTGCRNAIVAGAAFAQHLSVINRDCRCPNIRAVAVLADVRRLYVREVFACGFNAVVAANAVAANVNMIKIRR